MTDSALGDFESLIEATMEEWQIPGVAMTVVRDDEPVLLKTCGYRDGDGEH